MDNQNISKDDLERFDFTEEVMQQFREKSEIPIDFYNRNGQILIHRKESASIEDINRLQKFENQGIYFLSSDKAKISVETSDLPEEVNGQEVSFTKLVNPDLTLDMAKGASDILNDLKKNQLNGAHIKQVEKSIDAILDDFKNAEDMEVGLVNIIEVMKDAGVSTDSEVLTKRTVVSMALKIRGMKAFSKMDAEKQKSEQMSLMMASFLADIGYTRMKIPSHAHLGAEEYAYIKNHPMVSYLMTGNLAEIKQPVKTLILNHHRPHKGEQMSNNYPSAKTIVNKLNEYRTKYMEDYSKSVIVEDIPHQVNRILNNHYSEEDTGILSIAGEFASLTTPQPWRGPFNDIQAMKMILNNSFFSYTDKMVRDLFDYVGLSLCKNKSVLFPGDIVVLASIDSQKKVHFEVAKINEILRYQTRPVIQRLGFIRPKFSTAGKLRIAGFDLDSFKEDKRRAVYNLNDSGDPRRLIYVIDPDLDPEVYDSLNAKVKLH